MVSAKRGNTKMATPGKGEADYQELGSYNAVCYQCGRKRKAGMLVRHWEGYYVCPEHNEPRQPQDFVRGVQDVQTVPWSQPDTDTFIAVCTPEGNSATPGLALPGCMIAGKMFNYTTGAQGTYPSFCSLQGAWATADFGSADCATVGYYP